MYGASNDPYLLRENARPDGLYNNWGYNDPSGKAVRSQTLNTAQANLILITAGDSNMASVGPSAFTPTNSSVVDEINMYNGVIYAAVDPLLGPTISSLGPGGLSARVADQIISAGSFARVIIAPCAVGGSTTTMWAAGGPLYTRVPVLMARLAALGITPSTPNVTFAMVYQIGANEHGIAQATFQANYTQMVVKAQNAGFVGRVFVPEYSILANVADTTIEAAEAALVDNVTYFFGGNIDSLTGSTNRQADGTHLTTAGQASASTLIYNAMHASGAPF